jgi:hypothetical protein
MYKETEVKYRDDYLVSLGIEGANFKKRTSNIVCWLQE